MRTRKAGAWSRCSTTSTTSGGRASTITRFAAVRFSASSGYPEWVIRAILSHADYSGVPRDGLLEKTLFACDEMAGFVTAASLVRPSRSVLDLEADIGHEADEGQSVRAWRSSARTSSPAPRFSGCRSVCTSAT